MAEPDMVSDNNRSGPPIVSGVTANKKSSPDWADGLRQLYDSVVDEPLPDSFMDLLSQLDQEKPSKDPKAGRA